MKLRQILAAGAISTATILAAGCAVVQKGTTVSKWEGGKQEMVFTAMDDGKYALLKGSDYKPQFMIELRRGDALGFKPSTDGKKVTAVFGPKTMELEDGKYYWNYRGK